MVALIHVSADKMGEWRKMNHIIVAFSGKFKSNIIIIQLNQQPNYIGYY